MTIGFILIILAEDSFFGKNSWNLQGVDQYEHAQVPERKRDTKKRQVVYEISKIDWMAYDPIWSRDANPAIRGNDTKAAAQDEFCIDLKTNATDH